MKELRYVASTPGDRDQAAFRQAIDTGLQTLGLSLKEGGSISDGTQTLLLFASDGSGEKLWAIPDANLDAKTRKELDALHGAYFDPMITADLEESRWAAALELLTRLGALTFNGPDDGMLEEFREEFDAADVEFPDLDWVALKGDVWGGHDAKADGVGPAPVSHFYVVHLAN